MTDEERNFKIEKIKQRTLTKILGDATCNSTTIDEVEFRETDHNFASGACWMDMPRIKGRMNNDMKGVGQYNKLRHDNNGKIVTVISESTKTPSEHA